MSEAVAAAGFSRLLSDERLTRRAVGGDERAFAAIFRRYHQSLYRFCLAIVGNSEDAQDALQNTMMKVLRALPGEEREIELKPWLYRIAHNESIDLLRRRRETRELDVEQIAPGYGLAEDAETRERLRRLIADLKELPERQREVLVMRELAGLDFEEIGGALETSGAVARQTLYEARQSLRQMEEGREMSCEAVSRALSDGDGRVTRRRDVRAHLRSCANCREFGDEIKGRQRDLAALSPLPAVAAVGMLHGLLGGSGGAAAGGGLAATLGGGAAKTIGASAAAKGVATAAVVAAIGVTAADRTGVIHLGLPGDRTTQSNDSTPGGGGHSHGAGGGQGAAGGAGQSHSGSKGDGAAGAGAAPKGKGHSQGNHSDKQHPVTQPQGQIDHPRGAGHEKQHPPAASKGQETAEAQQPPPRESSGGSGDDQAAAKKPSTTPAPSSTPAPVPPTASPPKEAPANPPKAATEPQTQTQPEASDTPPPKAPPGPGSAPGKNSQPPAP
ncbi:MAG TPA: sigma-70 family RNA polymerase sigma factor [Solirubrobacterales bacterium]|nr:sigma-70 family RNA polymerase sigma factor [Solirubrobacterales bacterium]